MLRLTITLEDLQDTKRSASCLVSTAEGKLAAKILGRAGIQHEIEKIPPQQLYRLDGSVNSGGFLHELRTKEECIELLKEAFSNENPGALFAFLLENGKCDNGRGSAAMCEADLPSDPSDPSDLSDLQDLVTDTLLEVYKTSGLPGTKVFLRMACANFSAEYQGKENLMNTPDDWLLASLAEAILSNGGPSIT